MHRWAFLLLSLWLVACAQAPVAPLPDHLLDDTLFGAPSRPVRIDEVFAPSEEMRRYARTEIVARARVLGSRQQALAGALYQRQSLQLEYDAVETRNAAEAFAARSGNCLSLVIMTAAFAKELGLQVAYQSAFQEESWSRSGNLLVRSGHVNITLGRRLIDARLSTDERDVTIDFLPADDARRVRTRSIDEPTVLAMYLNNRAAESLAGDRLDEAYAWARAAVSQGTAFTAAINTLGVVYQRGGHLQQAERTFAHVLAVEPRNTHAMHNLALVLQHQGRVAESAEWRRRLAGIEPEPPFHYFHLGIAAMQREDFRTARDLFAREVARADYYHEFHYWLGLANFRLGDMERARKHLALAREHGPTRRDRELYAAKLAWLRQHGVH